MAESNKFNELSHLVLDELQAVFAEMTDESVRGLLELIKKAPRVFLIGGGREGLATKSFAMRLSHLGKVTYWIWDDTTPSIGQGDLLICASGSADTGHINHVIRMAKESGATIALVTASVNGVIAGMADLVTKVPAEAYRASGDFVKSEQLMGNLFEQTLFILFDVLVMMLRIELGISKADMVARHRNVE